MVLNAPSLPCDSDNTQPTCERFGKATCCSRLPPWTLRHHSFLLCTHSPPSPTSLISRSSTMHTKGCDNERFTTATGDGSAPQGSAYLLREGAGFDDTSAGKARALASENEAQGPSPSDGGNTPPRIACDDACQGRTFRSRGLLVGALYVRRPNDSPESMARLSA